MWFRKGEKSLKDSENLFLSPTVEKSIKNVKLDEFKALARP